MTPFNFAERACDECRLTFAPRSRTQRYCDECSTVDQRCEGCGGHFRIPRRDLNKRPARYCSTECRRQLGGLYFSRSAGRWFVICRDQGTFLFSRAVMSAHVGRELGAGEEVHHRNGDTTDDRLGNLELLTPREHRQRHRQDMRDGWARRREAVQG